MGDEITDIPAAGEATVWCRSDEGKGRPVVVVVERGQHGTLVDQVAAAMVSRTRVVVIESRDVGSDNWQNLSVSLQSLLQKLAIRHAPFVAFGDAAALVQQQYLAEPKSVRNLVLVNGSTRPHPSVATQAAQWIERRLPLGLPLRSIDRGFDSKSFLHRMRCPVLVVSTWNASSHERSQAALLADGLPTAWTLELEEDGAAERLAEMVTAFQAVPAKSPQRRAEAR